MKHILVYGDSNVWGSTEYDEHGRLPKNERWAGKLGAALGEEYGVNEAGYPGRCAGSFAAARESDKDYDGQEYYEIIFKAAAPIDLVVIALGTNDLKIKYQRTTEEIIDDLLWYAGRTRYLEGWNGKMPWFLYVLPPKAVNEPGWYEMNEEQRVKLVEKMKERTEEMGADFVDLEIVELTGDGVHFSVTGHEDVAKRVAAKIREIAGAGKLDGELKNYSVKM